MELLYIEFSPNYTKLATLATLRGEERNKYSKKRDPGTPLVACPALHSHAFEGYLTSLLFFLTNLHLDLDN